MEHVEVDIIEIIVNEINFHFIFIMSEGAEVPVFTFDGFIMVAHTKLLLVLVGSIELLDSVMGEVALFTMRTVTFLSFIGLPL